MWAMRASFSVRALHMFHVHVHNTYKLDAARTCHSNYQIALIEQHEIEFDMIGECVIT